MLANARRGATGRLLAALAAMALVAAACGDDSPDPGTTGADEGGRATLRIAYVPATTALALHVADQQGFFDEHDLDVTLTEAANISDIPATLGRQFDLSMGTATDLIRAGAAGIDVVQVAGNTVSTAENPFVRVITRPDSGITDVAGLKDKTVASPTLSGVIHVAVLFWAKQEGVDPASIKGVQVPPPNLADQLTGGRVDAVEALEPFATQLVKAGNVSLGDPFSVIADPLATNFIIAQGSWAEANGAVVDRFVAAMEQAVDFIGSSPDEARAILRGYTGLPEPVASSVALPEFDVEVRVGDLGRWIEVLREVDQFDAEVEPEDLVVQ
ncbi:MAG: ABC transporter substrate-binding protein [Acidimicrobiia bacterium]